MPGIKTRRSRARLIRFLPPVVVVLLVVAVWVQSSAYVEMVTTRDEMSGMGYGDGFLLAVMDPTSDFGFPPTIVSDELTSDTSAFWRTGFFSTGSGWIVYLPLWWLAVPPLLWIGWLLRPWRWRRKRTDED